MGRPGSAQPSAARTDPVPADVVETAGVDEAEPAEPAEPAEVADAAVPAEVQATARTRAPVVRKTWARRMARIVARHLERVRRGR